MPHLHTKPGQHDLTVSAFIIRTDFDQPKIMLHRHRKLNKLLQFGGHVEHNENPWAAIAHELREESGYELSQLQLLQSVDRLKELPNVNLHPQPVCVNTHPIDANDLQGAHFHIDMSYAFVAGEEPRHQPDAGESIDIRLLTREDLDNLSEQEIWPDTALICKYIFDTCLPKWDRTATRA